MSRNAIRSGICETTRHAAKLIQKEHQSAQKAKLMLSRKNQK